MRSKTLQSETLPSKALQSKILPALSFCLLTCPINICFAETLAYIGTYTQGDSPSEGIYVSSLDEASGELSAPRLAAEAVNPSFLAIHPNKRFLYAVSEVGGNDTVGLVAFRIRDDGSLEKLNEKSTRGGAACHVSIHPTGSCVAVANYSGGSCASFPIEENGSLGELASFHQHVGSSINPRRQTAPHAHSINFSPDGRQAFVADLGLDQILIYDVDASTGKMSPATPPYLKLPAGGGPRHFNFGTGGGFALANLEMTSQVVFLDYDLNKQSLTERSVLSTLPEGKPVPGNSTAECLVHPNGKTAYVSNRGHNSIAVVRVEAKSGEIRLLENESSGGEIPRGFGIDPNGQFLVVGNQRTGNVISLRIDPGSGKLSPTGSEIKVGTPVNVRFVER